MAGAGYKLFVNGNTLSASDLNTYVQQQTVMVFASASARTTALSGVLAEGMVSYRTDSHVFEIYNGTAWIAASPTTTKGDLATFDTAPARLPVGSNGQVLLADSTQATGIKWGTASSGQLQQVVFTSSNASYTIPSGVTQMEILAVGGGGGGGSTNSGVNSAGGCGGAGQVKTQLITISGDTTLNITVGAGGAGGALSNTSGSTGSVSTVVGNTSTTTYVTAAGGGGGGGGGGTSGVTGASSGGFGGSSTSLIAGGGGMGGPPTSTTNAVNYGTSPTTLGVTGYPGSSNSGPSVGGAGIIVWNRALGGGGGDAGLGNNFGGGLTGAKNATGVSGTANTGGGGVGAVTTTSSLFSGGAGGSGLVVIRYVG